MPYPMLSHNARHGTAWRLPSLAAVDSRTRRRDWDRRTLRWRRRRLLDLPDRPRGDASDGAGAGSLDADALAGFDGGGGDHDPGERGPTNR